MRRLFAAFDVDFDQWRAVYISDWMQRFGRRSGRSLAVERGGEVMGWLEPGDLLHTKGLLVIGSVFSSFPNAEWITGRPFNFSPNGMPTGMKHLERWSRIRFLAGSNRYTQQESTYWRRGLWDRAGGQMDASRREGSDFELWVRFFRHARLYPVDALIGGFRVHPDSLSLGGPNKMRRIHDRQSRG